MGKVAYCRAQPTCSICGSTFRVVTHGGPGSLMVGHCVSCGVTVIQLKALLEGKSSAEVARILNAMWKAVDQGQETPAEKAVGE